MIKIARRRWFVSGGVSSLSWRFAKNVSIALGQKNIGEWQSGMPPAPVSLARAGINGFRKGRTFI
ncbi:hypothetical protein [Bradyrhizobium canariense]|uniref:hypothetical protein n=1 Tax=Bradyrhizobium canariense TaxID=255045 RepID=UPI0011BA86F3|nr:hypothetical protein [Bradyrhizobium canariense]